MSRQAMLTTTDNPFDPFTDYWNWLDYDNVVLGHCSLDYLARIAKTSDELTEEENEAEIERAIDEIVRYDVTNLYKKVVRTDGKTSNSSPEPK